MNHLSGVPCRGTLFAVLADLSLIVMNTLSYVVSVCAVLALVQCSPVQPQPAAPARPALQAARAVYMPADFCYVDEVAPAVRADLKYSGSDNFVGRPIAGYEGHRPILRRDTAEALARVQAALEKQGYGLLLWDAYRPARAMLDFRAWSRTADDHTKAEFYPNITKQGIYEGRYIGNASEHSWGIAVDLTLVHLATGELVDMGGRHDLLDAASATNSPLVSAAQRANRQRLRNAMNAAGFSNYSKEWWHYRLRDSQPWKRYDFPVRDDLLRL